jgi:hypothetical protein
MSLRGSAVFAVAGFARAALRGFFTAPRFAAAVFRFFVFPAIPISSAHSS